MYSATASATYSATSSGTASATGNTLIEAVNNANIAALTAAKNAISNPPVPCETIEVDNLIIGSGIGGTYLSARLSNFKPNETLLIVDKLSNYGGLQISTQIPDTSTYIELGPIRFFKNKHPRVYYLSQKYNLPLTQYIPDNDSQIYYLRDKLFTHENLYPGSDSVYNIREDEKGINPFTTLTDNISKFFTNTDNVSELTTRIELFKNVFLSNNVFQSLAQQNMSEENWQRVTDINGYNDALSIEISFLIIALEFLSLNESSIQYRFTNGYQSLTKTIANKNNINTITFNEINPNTFSKNPYNSLFNTAVLNINLCSSKNMWEIKIGNVNVNSPEDISYMPTDIKIIYAKTIYSTIPLLYLKNIHKFSNPYLNLCENSFTSLPIIRIYLNFEKDWMTERGIGFGKSITTLNGAQLIHYADKVLLIYGFGSQCSKLYNFLPNNIQIQKEMIPPNISNELLIKECRKVIKESYCIDELPNINGIAYSTWVQPLRWYTGRNLTSLKNESLYDTLMNIMFPYGKGGNFYVLENSSSFNSSWCEGSLEIVDFYLNLIYGQPLFGETLIK